jgi:AcrR family transcriptional regulator
VAVQGAALAMIEAAERMAAERGLAAVTAQAVQDAAGQRNRSAVQYHFGGRQGLVDAVVRHRMGPANERRAQLFVELGERATVRDLVQVLVVPLVESVLSRTPSYWARFLLQALSDPTTGLAALASVDDRVLAAATTRLERHLTHLSPEARTLRVQSVFGYAAVVLAAYETGLLPPSPTGAALTAEIVDACCALVGAPNDQEQR